MFIIMNRLTPNKILRAKFSATLKTLVPDSWFLIPGSCFLVPDSCFLRLDTPLIPADDNFLSAEKVLQSEVADKLGEKFSVEKIFASYVEIENFVVTWGMRRPHVQALAKGSVFELKIPDGETLSSERLLDGFGLRTEEGFGQLRLWTPEKNFTLGKIDDEKISKPQKFSELTIELAKKILKAHLLEQVRIYAHEDSDKLCGQLRLRGGMTHFFSRLDGLIASCDKKNLRENFKAHWRRNFAARLILPRKIFPTTNFLWST